MLIVIKFQVRGFVRNNALQQGHLISVTSKNRPQNVHRFCPF